MLKIYDKRDNIVNKYQSEPKLFKINSSINIFVKSKIIIDHVFIYKTDYSYQNMTSIKINNKTLTNKKDYFYYSLSESIILNNDIYNQINITSDNTDSNNYYIIFIGYYDFKSGILWNSTHESNIFSNSNISIKNNNPGLYALNVTGNILGNTSKIIYNINSKNSIINNINTPYLNISNNITSSNNKLYINTNNISIGTTKNTSFCSIGDNTTFSLNGKINTLDISSTELDVKNNLLSSSKYNINDNLIQLNNIRIKKNNGILTKHLDTQIYLKNNVNIKSVYSNSKLIDIKGKLKITNNLVISNNFNVGYLIVNNYESDILKNSGYVNVDNLFKSKNFRI